PLVAGVCGTLSLFGQSGALRFEPALLVPNTSTHSRASPPNANLINLRALDQNGSGTDGTVISAIQEAIQLKSMYNIRVINLSLSLSAARSLRATNSIPFAKPSRRPGKRESWLSSRQEIQDAITRRAQTATPPLPPRATILTSSPWVQ